MAEIRARADLTDFGRDVRVQIGQINGTGMDSIVQPLVFDENGVLKYSGMTAPFPRDAGNIVASLQMPYDVALQVQKALNECIGLR